MEALATITCILILVLTDRIDTRITRKIKDRLGDSWKKYRFLIAGIHLLICGFGLVTGICAYSLIKGNTPPIWTVLKLVLIILTAALMVSMLSASVIWLFKALSKNNKELSTENEFKKQVKNAFLFLFLFFLTIVMLFLEFKFFLWG